MTVFLLCLGIAFSQFYISNSGTPQPAHYLIALALVGFLLSRGRVILPRKGRSTLILLFAFVIYQATVNAVYFAGTNDFSFLMQLVYIVYGFLVFLLIANLFLIDKELLGKISFFGFLGLLGLFFMPLLGLGEYKFPPRYNAFFNDPNQMAFWVLCVAAICIYYYGNSGRLILIAVIFFATAFLVFLTASRSGLVGFSVMVIGFLINYLKAFWCGLTFKKVPVYFAGICVISYGFYYFLNSDLDVVSYLLSRADLAEAGEQARIRGYTRILEYPERIFLGAGHGMEGRFDVMETEIHSTWAGVLFYYGLPGLIFFTTGIYSIVKTLSLSERLIFLAPLFYSFSTFGLRTPIFWVFLGFFYAVVLKRQNEPKSNAHSRPHHLPRPLPGAFPSTADQQVARPGNPGSGSGTQL